MSEPFVHRIRPRYAEVDQQGVVFNAHWLTYFDDSCTRFFESLGYTPNEAFFGEFDVMIVKAVLEWEGPAGFDEVVDIATEPIRLGTKSFDLRYRASVKGNAVCTGVITYVSVKPSTHESTPIPAALRARLESVVAAD
ncbi:MAG: acyl-CoA thioesterase [Acidimicrobiia bacterium]